MKTSTENLTSKGLVLMDTGRADDFGGRILQDGQRPRRRAFGSGAEV